MHRIALYGLAVVLLDRGKVDGLVSRSAELLRLARETARIAWKLVAMEGYSSIIALVAARGEKNAASAMLSDLISGIAQETFPMAVLRRTADLLKAAIQPIQLCDLLTMKTIVDVGPRCRCCSAAKWARTDCLMAKLHLHANGPSVGGFLFRRVLKTYGLLAETDSLISDVVRECDREIKMTTTSDGLAIAAPERSTPTPMDLLDLVVMAFEGKPSPPKR
jgi:hypothetical protein